MPDIEKAASGVSGGTCPTPEARESRAAGCSICWSERPARPQAMSWYRLAYLVSYIRVLPHDMANCDDGGDAECLGLTS